LLEAVTNHKHVWVKKATGLGVSEFMLRFMAWLCLKDNAFWTTVWADRERSWWYLSVQAHISISENQVDSFSIYSMAGTTMEFLDCFAGW